jgi:hypothetical protein
MAKWVALQILAHRLIFLSEGWLLLLLLLFVVVVVAVESVKEEEEEMCGCFCPN